MTSLPTDEVTASGDDVDVGRSVGSKILVVCVALMVLVGFLCVVLTGYLMWRYPDSVLRPLGWAVVVLGTVTSAMVLLLVVYERWGAWRSMWLYVFAVLLLLCVLLSCGYFYVGDSSAFPPWGRSSSFDHFFRNAGFFYEIHFEKSICRMDYDRCGEPPLHDQWVYERDVGDSWLREKLTALDRWL